MHLMAQLRAPAHPLTGREEWEMVWRAGWYSSAPGLNLPYFPLTLFFFFNTFFTELSAYICSPGLSPWLGWQRDLQQP